MAITFKETVLLGLFYTLALYHLLTHKGLDPYSEGSSKLIVPFHYSWGLMEVWIATTGADVLEKKRHLRAG